MESNCCGASAVGYIDDDKLGMCSACYEWAEFEEEEEETPVSRERVEQSINIFK